MSDSTREMNEALQMFSFWMAVRNWNYETRIFCESIAETFVDYLCSRNLALSQITPRIVSDYLEERAKMCARPLISNHCSLLVFFLESLQRKGIINEEFAMDEIRNRLEKPPGDDNVTCLHGKPGFYKKGPLQFGLYFGTLDEMEEKAGKAKEERDESRKKARKGRLKAVKDEEENPGEE